MRLPVGEIDVDRETGGGIPDGGDAVAAAGGLQGARVGRGGGPGIRCLAGESDGGVRGDADRIVDEVVATGAVDVDPVALRRSRLSGTRRRPPVLMITPVETGTNVYV